MKKIDYRQYLKLKINVYSKQYILEMNFAPLSTRCISKDTTILNSLSKRYKYKRVSISEEKLIVSYLFQRYA